MAHLHRHPHTNHDHRATTRTLAIALALTAGYTLAEALGGYWSNSLALLADAGHMLTDSLALALAWFAAWAATRPPDPRRTFGYQRAEILAALLNGTLLIVIAGSIALEAWQRAGEPPPVDAGLMALVAGGGLVVNLVAAWLLGGQGRGLNLRAAYLHVLGDLFGSVGTLAAAAAIAWRGWLWADPAISFVIAGVIVLGAIRLVLESVQVLMEAAPPHLNTAEIRARLAELPGVGGVHDLHIWSLRGELPLLSAHLVLDHGQTNSEVLRSATRLLNDSFGIAHVTLQIEPPDFNIVQPIGGANSAGRS